MKAVYVLNESQKEQLNKKKIKIKEEPSVGSFTSKDEGNLKRIYYSFFLTALCYRRYQTVDRAEQNI